MNVTITEPAARTDVRTDAASTPTATTVRKHALTLAAGALTWSVLTYAYGYNPDTEFGVTAGDLGGLAFQVGVMALVALQLRTRATGVSRRAATMLRVEQVFLSIAMLWSLLHAFLPSARDSVWLGVLDVFWPLSMLGMFAIGVKIAMSGRWQGPARFWPLVAESWVVFTIPVMVIVGETAADLAGATHVLVGYVALGLILAARPDLVLRRD